MRAVDDNGGLLMTPRRHVLAELDPHNHAVATLKARLLSKAVQSCLEDEHTHFPPLNRFLDLRARQTNF